MKDEIAILKDYQAKLENEMKQILDGLGNNDISVMYDKYIQSMKNNQIKDIEIATLKRKLKTSKKKKVKRAKSYKSSARRLDFTLSPTSRSNYSNK